MSSRRGRRAFFTFNPLTYSLQCPISQGLPPACDLFYHEKKGLRSREKRFALTMKKVCARDEKRRRPCFVVFLPSPIAQKVRRAMCYSNVGSRKINRKAMEQSRRDEESGWLRTNLSACRQMMRVVPSLLHRPLSKVSGARALAELWTRGESAGARLPDANLPRRRPPSNSRRAGC